MAYAHDIIKMPLAVSSLRLFKKMVNKTTFAKSAKVEIAERIVF